MARSSVVVGAHVLCFINGVLMGEAVAVEWSPVTDRVMRKSIDNIMSDEISVTNASLQGSVNIIRLHGTGGAEGRGIVAPFTHTALEKYFSILLVDRANGKTLARADYCSVTRQNWRFAAKQLVTGSFSFLGLDATSEAEYSS